MENVWTVQSWKNEVLMPLLSLGDRRINIQAHSDTGQVFINLINLPESICQAGEGGGAEMQNNREMLVVQKVGDKLKVSQSIRLYQSPFKLRGKTGSPEKIAEYIATHLNRIAAEVKPNYTHSKPPIV